MRNRFLAFLFLAALATAVSAQQSGTYRNEPWNGMQIKYSIGGATVTSHSESGPFCCWINTLKGDLAASGNLTVSGAVGMQSGYYADAVVTVTVDGKSQSWKERVKPAYPNLNWANFNVSVPIPQGAKGGSILVEMTGSYNAGTRGLSVSGTFGRGGEAAAEQPPAPPVLRLPPPSPPPPVKKDRSANEAAADAMDEIIHQFDDTCFGKVVRLGDPAKYRDQLINKITINAGSSLTKKRDSLGSHEVAENGKNIIHLPFDPAAGKMSIDNKWTIFHETTHQIEWSRGDQENPLRKDMDLAGFKDRNTHYLDKAVAELRLWKLKEKRITEGLDTAADAQSQWNNFERSMRQLEAGMAASELKGADGQWWRPGLGQLEAWAGIRIRFDDIRQQYLSNACGGKGGAELRKLVQGKTSGPAKPESEDVNQEFRDFKSEHPQAGKR
jgi:hypothetical protein